MASSPPLFLNQRTDADSYTLSLHDALPIWIPQPREKSRGPAEPAFRLARQPAISSPENRRMRDRKSTRLNSSHVENSYAVFCLKKKKCKACNTKRFPT